MIILDLCQCVFVCNVSLRRKGPILKKKQKKKRLVSIPRRPQQQQKKKTKKFVISVCLVQSLFFYQYSVFVFAVGRWRRRVQDVTRIHHERFHENVLNEQQLRRDGVIQQFSRESSSSRKKDRDDDDDEEERGSNGGHWSQGRSIFRTQATVRANGSSFYLFILYV